MGITAWQVIDDAVAVYRAFSDVETLRPRSTDAEMESTWDNLSGAMRSAIGRRIASCMGAEWVARQVDPFNKFLAFVEVCVSGSRIAFLVKTPPAVLATAAAVAGFDSWARERMGTPAPISGGSPAANPLDATLATFREGLATLHRAYETYPNDVTAGLIRDYEAALRELTRRATPPPPKPPARGGQHAKPTTDDDGSWTVGILGYTYDVTPLPIDPAIGSHAYSLVNRSRNQAYDVYRDLFGQPECDCGDFQFRRSGSDRSCKHVIKLQELGLMPLTPRVLPPLAQRQQPAARSFGAGIL